MPVLALVVAATAAAHAAASLGRGPAQPQGACSLDEVVLLQGVAAVQGRAQSVSVAAAELSQGFLQQAEGANLLIQNLDEYTSEDTLRELFEPFGAVTSVALPQTEQGRGQGFGFVSFASRDSATKAISEMHLKIVKGQPLHVALLAAKSTEPPKVLDVAPLVQNAHKKPDVSTRPPQFSFRDTASALWHRLGIVGGNFGSNVFFPEDDEGTETLPGNFPNRSNRFAASAALVGGPRTKHKVGVRRQWAVVKQHSYCANHRKAVTGTVGRMQVPRCQDLAMQDSECGDTVYSNGETDCYCVMAGYECELKPSTRANSVFRRLLPLANEEYESTLLHRWSRMRKKKRAALFNFTEGKQPNGTANGTLVTTEPATEEDEAPPGMKLIAMPPDLASRLQTISIIFFLTLPAIMASWCVTSVTVK
mmetsp:Transcript_2060/g.5352  ORF Transcript_2060/g.5352 Transcript_2060/m.5352 type:complete len:421 (-) Transcript_2060:60-1322(-)